MGFDRLVGCSGGKGYGLTSATALQRDRKPAMHCSSLPRYAALLALGALMLSACDASAQSQPTAFVSIAPQKSFLQRIAGDLVETEVLVPPGASPVTHEPTPRQMLGLAEATVWFRIGVPFEDAWAPRIRANYPQLSIIDTRAAIDVQSTGARDGRPDPHIWMSPRLVMRQAETIRDALIELFPENEQAFRAGHAAFAAEVAELDRNLTARFAGLSNRRFMIYHPALGHFARAYGLEQIAIEIDGREPGPASLMRIIRQAREADIHVIFVQQEFSRSAADAVARAIDGDVISIAPLAENTLENIRSIADALLQVLE